MIKKTLTSNFFTTCNFKTAITALWCIISPFRVNKIQSGQERAIAENKLLEFICGTKESRSIYSFYNARSALYHGLKYLWIWSSDEVILQAYTCVSVSNAIIQTWATPVYADIDSSLNLDPALLEGKISSNTKAIIIQHTFGNPANLKKIIEIAKNQGIYVIEDCAQGLWAKYNDQHIWTFGDLSIFSFGRDKIISTVNWWFLIINNQRISSAYTVKDKLSEAPKKLIYKNLFYLFISYIWYKLYDLWWIGKFLMLYSKKYKITPEVLSRNEKQSNDKTFFYKYPNALAYISLQEIENIQKYNDIREEIAGYYDKQLVPLQERYGIKCMKTNNNAQAVRLRYTIFIDNPVATMQYCKKDNILLWDWYQQVVAPVETDLLNAGYEQWACLEAERLASKSLNLPCHPNINKEDSKRVIESFTQYLINHHGK